MKRAFLNTYLVYILWFLLVSSCYSIIKDDKELSLQKVGIHALALDSNSGHYHNSFGLIHSNNRIMSFFLNVHNYTIYINDWKTGAIVKKISILQNGPNSISGNPADGIFFNSKGEFFYYAENKYRLYRFQNAVPIAIYNVLNHGGSKENDKFDIPSISAMFPILSMGDSVFFLTSDISVYRVKDFTILNSLLKFQKQADTFSMKRLVPCPELYNRGNWGRTLGYQAYHIFNADSTKIFTSFGKYDSIVVTNISDLKRKTVYAGSRFFNMDKEVLISNVSDKDESDFETGVKYDFTHPVYFKLMYDPTNEKYYRMTQYAFPDNETIKKNKGEIRLGISYSFIVLDKNLQKIDEAILPDNTEYNMNHVFAREGMLLIAPLPKYQPYEDSLIFHKFQLKGL